MVNTIKPDLDDKKDTETNQDTEANLDAGIGMDSDQAFNIDFDTRLNMARAMVKVLNNADLVDCFTSVSARSMRNEADKAAYMAMREELLRRMQNENKDS